MRKVLGRCALVLAVVLAIVLPVQLLGGSSDTSRTEEAHAAERAGEEAAGEDPDAELGGDPDAEAVRIGEAQLSQVVAAPAAGWAGESVVGVGNTWEPSVAADPSGPYVYAMYNDFSAPKACNTCPQPPMIVRASS